MSLGVSKVSPGRKHQFVGHIISSSNDDNLDILNWRNSLCGQINDILCYFGFIGSVTKLRLLKAYCSSYYDVSYGIWDVKLLIICV